VWRLPIPMLMFDEALVDKKVLAAAAQQQQ
jgi:hypothetical protein